MRTLIGLAAGWLAMAASAQASPGTATDAVIAADTPRLVAMFKDIHRNPELAFMEQRTAGIVARELKGLGFTVTTGIAQTGVVAILRNGPGPTVMYRADMDANAVAEATGLPYASTVRTKRADGKDVPVAHMCGHDAHVTWMLGMAKAMIARKSDWKGTLVLVGQPAEETIEGAVAMVKDGLYEKHGVPVPDVLIALHTAPVATGKIILRGGVQMAGTDQIDVTFKGVGGHGSSPHLAKDPVVMGAYAITQYQSIVSRRINPADTGVLTVGSFQAGTDNNVIPDSALLKLNLRFFKDEVREQLIQGIKDVNQGVVAAHGLSPEEAPQLVMKGHSSPLVNDEAATARMKGALSGLLGEANVIGNFPPALGSEDAHMLRGPNSTVPVVYIAVGIAEPARVQDAAQKGKLFPFFAHSPHYVVDLDAIGTGTRIATTAVLSAFKQQ